MVSVHTVNTWTLRRRHSAVASEMIGGYNHRLKGKLRHIGAHIPRYLTFAHDFAEIRSSFTTMTCRGRYPLRAVSGL